MPCCTGSQCPTGWSSARHIPVQDYASAHAPTCARQRSVPSRPDIVGPTSTPVPHPSQWHEVRKKRECFCMCSVLKCPPQILCTVGVSLCPTILAHIHHVYLSAPCLTFQPIGANARHVCQLLSFFNLLLATILQKGAESLVTHRSAAPVCPGQGVILSHVCFVNFSAYAISVQVPSGCVTNTSVVYPPLW